MKNPIRVAGIALLFACGLAVLSRTHARSAVREETTTEKTVSARGLDHVKTDVSIGSIRVTADSEDSVRIRAVRHVEGGSAEDRRRWLQETRVTIETHDRTLEIKDVIPKSLQNYHASGRNFKMNLDVDLHLPDRLNLMLASGVGDVTVDGQAGGVHADAGVGTIQLKRLRCAGRAVDAHTGAGDIHIEGQTGTLTVEDGAGRIEMKGLECSGKTIRVKTGAGDVVAALRATPSDSFHVHAGTGNIRISLPAQVKASVEMSAGVGGVHSAFSLPSRRRGDFEIGASRSGEINGGGFGLRLDVGVGDIRLEKGTD